MYNNVKNQAKPFVVVFVKEGQMEIVAPKEVSRWYWSVMMTRKSNVWYRRSSGVWLYETGAPSVAVSISSSRATRMAARCFSVSVSGKMIFHLEGIKVSDSSNNSKGVT